MKSCTFFHTDSLGDDKIDKSQKKRVYIYSYSGGGLAFCRTAFFWMRGGGVALTAKQERFVQEYLVDLNATAAAIRAGYSPKTANRIASENLSKPDIQIALQKARDDIQRRTKITQDMVIAEIAKLGFFDIRKLFDKDGKPLDISQLDDNTAAALVGLDVQDVSDSDGNYVGFIKKYKMADKVKVLELLGKHLGAWEPQDKQQTAVEDLSPLAEKLRE